MTAELHMTKNGRLEPKILLPDPWKTLTPRAVSNSFNRRCVSVFV
jgi:hypothetical protein